VGYEINREFEGLIRERLSGHEVGFQEGLPRTK
jgi:hypothetical protein